MKIKIFSAFLFTFVLWSQVASSAGPFYVYPEDKGGAPYSWAGGKIKWKYDAGGLSAKVPALPSDSNKSYCKALTKDPCEAMETCGAVKCIESLFKKWADAHIVAADELVYTAGLSIENAGPMDGDVNIDDKNYVSYRDKAEEEGVALIIFDATGSIIAKEGFDPLSLGLSEPLRSENSPYYHGGVVILNGVYLDDKENLNAVSEKDINPSDLTGPQFAGSWLHEIGHVLGLDHTQPQQSVFNSSISDVSVPEGLPTMYPKLIIGEAPEDHPQFDLHYDDVVGISSLYSSTSFNQKFCEIKGSIKHKNGSPYQGINVIAYSSTEGEGYTIATSFVTGGLYPPNTTDANGGNYILGGIIPCKPYRVIYESIFEAFQCISDESCQGSINPYYNGFKGPDEDDIKEAVSITSGNYDSDVVTCNPDKICDKGPLPEDYSLSTKEINMDDPPAPSEPASDAPAKKKGWFGCALVKD